jgi:hypothetical protein
MRQESLRRNKSASDILFARRSSTRLSHVAAPQPIALPSLSRLQRGAPAAHIRTVRRCRAHSPRLPRIGATRRSRLTVSAGEEAQVISLGIATKDQRALPSGFLWDIVERSTALLDDLIATAEFAFDLDSSN